ncbi:hypothetical protein BHM03_00062641 [Ensete ventricosum]|nr:hypothetical protein BHM03_00062641 [Ensete ventricosum]
MSEAVGLSRRRLLVAVNAEQPKSGWGSRKAYQERYNEILPEFPKRFTEGIGKLAGNTLGDHRKKTGRLVTRMSDWRDQYQVQAEIRKVEGTTFAEIPTGKPLVSDGCTATAQDFGRLTRPGWAIESPAI